MCVEHITVSPHSSSGTFFPYSILLAASISIRFVLFATPFCWGGALFFHDLFLLCSTTFVFHYWDTPLRCLIWCIWRLYEFASLLLRRSLEGSSHLILLL
jgi:hypothetical protein